LASKFSDLCVLNIRPVCRRGISNSPRSFLSTDIIFNKGVEIREFAAHTLLPEESGRQVLKDYFRGFPTLAKEMDAGFQLDTQTWKAHMHWADDLKVTEADFKKANQDAIAFISELRDEFKDNKPPSSTSTRRSCSTGTR
jgi:S-methylmethionine-dependent homocysteine/selenocysteine methylase